MKEKNKISRTKILAGLALVASLLIILFSFTSCGVTAKACLEKFPPPKEVIIKHSIDTVKIPNSDSATIDSLISLIVPCPEIDTTHGNIPLVLTPAQIAAYEKKISALNAKNKQIESSLGKTCKDSIITIHDFKKVIKPDSATNKQLEVVGDKLIEKTNDIHTKNKWLLWSILLNIALIIYIFRYQILNILTALMGKIPIK